MAKISGITASVAVDDSGGVARTISADVRSLSINTSRGEADITGLDKSSTERLLLREDTTISLAGVYDAGTNLAHDVFKTVGTQAGTVTRTATIGFPVGTAAVETVPANYNVSLGEDGQLNWSVDLHTANGTAIAWT